jgi:hypothetical protein
MKNKIQTLKTGLISIAISVAASFGFNHSANGECTVVSANGYTVTISVNPVAIVPSTTTNCTWGYNFNYRLTYTISLTGSNIPSSLNTLQGYVSAPGYSDNFFDLPNNGGSGTVLSTGNNYTARTDCNSATVSSFNPTIVIEMQGPGISNRTFICPSTSLPIKLVSFTGTNIEEGVLLNWSTATEENNNYFTVERSSDAKEWNALAEINGAGTTNSVQNYTYTDAQAAAGINYYRIKQTDVNGVFTYSSAIKVGNIANDISTSVYPNPATPGSDVTVKISTTDAQEMEIQIFNQYGQVVKSYSVPAGNGGYTTHMVQMPEAGNMFFVNIIQNGSTIGKYQIIAAR